MHSPAAPSTPGITPAIQHSADHPALALSGPAPTPNGAPKGIPKGLPAVLFRAGYTAENLTKVGALPRGDAPGLPLWELPDRASGDGPLEVLARVFLLAQSEKPSLIAKALAPDSSLNVDVDDAGRRVAHSLGLSDSPNDATRRAREVVGGLARLGYFEPDTPTRYAAFTIAYPPPPATHNPQGPQ